MLRERSRAQPMGSLVICYVLLTSPSLTDIPVWFYISQTYMWLAFSTLFQKYYVQIISLKLFPLYCNGSFSSPWLCRYLIISDYEYELLYRIIFHLVES
jgi:hypothetical protein